MAAWGRHMQQQGPSQSQELVPARSQRIARTVLIVALAVLGFWTLRGFVPALAWAVILAIAVWPLYQRAERRFPPGRHNILLPALFTLLIALVFVLPLLFAAVQVAHEARDLFAWYQAVQKTGLPPPDWLAGVQIGSWHAADWWKENLANPPALS